MEGWTETKLVFKLTRMILNQFSHNTCTILKQYWNNTHTIPSRHLNDTWTILRRYSDDTQTILERYPNDTQEILERYSNRYSRDTQTILEHYSNDTPMILERYSNITGMILYDTKTILQWYSNSNSTILTVSRNVYQSRSIERWVHSGLPSISIVDPSSRSQLQNIVNDNCFTQLKHLSKSFELLEAYSNSSKFIYTATALWLSIQANLNYSMFFT